MRNYIFYEVFKLFFYIKLRIKNEEKENWSSKKLKKQSSLWGSGRQSKKEIAIF